MTEQRVYGYSRSSCVRKGTYRIVNDADDEGAAWTPRDIFLVTELSRRDFEAVATRAGVVEDLLRLVKLHVL